VALWQAVGLHIQPKGRDSREAFEWQLASGIRKVIGIETQQGVVIFLSSLTGLHGIWLFRSTPSTIMVHLFEN